MTNPAKIYNELKPRQIKPEPLKCTVSAQCWCNRVKDFRYSSELEWDGECMSPADMLERFDAELSNRDKFYLQSLLHRVFVS